MGRLPLFQTPNWLNRWETPRTPRLSYAKTDRKTTFLHMIGAMVGQLLDIFHGCGGFIPLYPALPSSYPPPPIPPLRGGGHRRQPECCRHPIPIFLKYVTHVEFEFNGFSEQEMREFMERFDRAYQREGE